MTVSDVKEKWTDLFKERTEAGTDWYKMLEMYKYTLERKSFEDYPDFFSKLPRHYEQVLLERIRTDLYYYVNAREICTHYKWAENPINPIKKEAFLFWFKKKKDLEAFKEKFGWCMEFEETELHPDEGRKGGKV